MSIASTIKADLMTVAVDFNTTMHWNGEDYICVAGTAGDELILGDGGFEHGADLVIVLNRDVFTDGILPKEQQTVTFPGASGPSFRIHKVNIDALGALIRLTLTSITKGLTQ